MGHKRKSPLAHAGAERALNKNTLAHITKFHGGLTPPYHVTVYLEEILMRLGSNNYITPRFSTALINDLDSYERCEMDYIQEFRAEMARNGLNYTGEIIPDGLINRFHVDDDSNNSENGWYILFNDGIPAGAYGCWKRNFTKSWCAKSESQLTPTEWGDHCRQINAARQQRDRIQAEIYQQTAERANRLWNTASPADSKHPYLIRKCVQPYNLRQLNSRLLVPLSDAGGNIHNLQLIDTDGNKRFLRGGRVNGMFSLLGSLQTADPLYICEGWATAASIRDITSCTVIAAMNAGNLPSVAEILRKSLPIEASFIIAADNDRHNLQNPGITKGKIAAEMIGARLIWPQFNCSNCNCTDFNDLHNCERNQGGEK